MLEGPFVDGHGRRGNSSAVGGGEIVEKCHWTSVFHLQANHGGIKGVVPMTTALPVCNSQMRSTNRSRRGEEHVNGDSTIVDEEEADDSEYNRMSHDNSERVADEENEEEGVSFCSMLS